MAKRSTMFRVRKPVKPVSGRRDPTTAGVTAQIGSTIVWMTDVPNQRMNRIIDAWIPPAVVRHPWPNQRFDVSHPRQEPSALAAHARICARGGQ